MLSLACHEKFQLSMQNSVYVSRAAFGNITLGLYFAQMACSFTRGAILYQVLDTSKPARATNDTKLKTVYATMCDVNIFVTSFWWIFSVLYGVLYYYEVRVHVFKLERDISVCACARLRFCTPFILLLNVIMFLCFTDCDMHY